ncbi:MAG: hypothetical protein AB1714_18805 [Acidobacteriota bacterium]
MGRSADLDFERCARALFARIPEYASNSVEVARIAKSLLSIAEAPGLRAALPDAPRHASAIHGAVAAADPERLEAAMLGLYAKLHELGAAYSADERSRLYVKRGYMCHAGGLSPILRAGPFIRSDTISIDLGAGNGLQGLLLQLIHPHRRTIQVELSASLIEAGRRLQALMLIEPARIEWRRQDIAEANVHEASFIYLYRPARPVDGGRKVYEAIAGRLNTHAAGVVVFSVADCLRALLSRDFKIVFADGHLTCFRKDGT